MGCDASMTAEIQFGELEEDRPRAHLRPDCNRHYCVRTLGVSCEDDLPVFVDMDVMCEMEDHAATNADVEVGGVLLGRQCKDMNGRPFVVITDSLQARYSESTRGSFKFTHDTWEQITRERETFPSDLQMVGWYHTHPGWGVFLSSMDTFICENFFNRPLDLALVIDPSRRERGFFQWDEKTNKTLQPVGAFHLIASRFRQQQLTDCAATLEGSLAMSGDPRTRSYPPAPYPSPIVTIAEGRSPWFGAAVIGSLAMQFCLLALIALRTVSPDATNEKIPDSLADIQKNIGEMAEARQRDVQVNAKIDALDDLISQAGEGTQTRLVRLLAERNAEITELRAGARGRLALENELEAKITGLSGQLEQSRQRESRLNEQIQRLQDSVAGLRSDGDAQRDRVKALETKLAAYENPQSQSAAPSEHDPLWWQTWWILGATVAVLAAGGVTAAWLRWRNVRRHENDMPEESSGGTNNPMS